MRLTIDTAIPVDSNGELDTRQLSQCIENALGRVPVNPTDVIALTLTIRDEWGSKIGLLDLTQE